jgi:spermidine synthase
VGIVGLGAGTLAANGQPGDYFRFYEIDPQVVDFSLGWSSKFTFLKDSPATIDIVIGDARLSLAEETVQGHLQKFDVLILDAFSSDSITVIC